MLLAETSLAEFSQQTYSKAPAPGGGGVAAAAGALGAALAGMVGNLTAGKKKYAQYEEDIQRILAVSKEIMDRLIALIDEDAENFIPVSKAYGLKGDTPEEKEKNAKILQDAMKVAVSAPIEIVKVAYSAIDLLDELYEKGSTLAISDVGCGAALLRAGLDAGWLNVLININSITDASFTEPVRAELSKLVEEGRKRCDALYEKVALKMNS